MPDIFGWQPISSETKLIALAAKQFSKYKWRSRLFNGLVDGKCNSK